MDRYNEIKELIRSKTINIDEVVDQSIAPFRWLASSIGEGKANLKTNTVDFIVIKVLDKEDRVYKFKTKQSFDVYVFGTFRKYFNPTKAVADAFAEFYLEMGILPNIIAVPKHILIDNQKDVLRKISNGVLIYERR